MNPITAQAQYKNILAQVKAGRLDPRGEVMRMLNGASPAQKARIKNMLPIVGRLASACGYDATVLQDIDGHL